MTIWDTTSNTSPAFLGRRGQSGQIAVIVLLLMVVLMTVGLSLATRTTEELFLSTQQAESTRVFNAAESGVEDALSQEEIESVTGTQPGSLTVGETEVNYTITGSNELETLLEQGKSILVNLDADGNGTGDVSTGTLQIYWWGATKGTNCSTDSPASLIVSEYFADGGTTRSRFIPVGPCNGGTDRNDGYLTPTSQSAGNGFRYRHDLSMSGSTAKFLRIKAVYNDTHIRVSGVAGANLPTQFHTVRSTATNNNGDETRTVEVKRTLSTAPSFMEYAVYTPGSLQQE